MVLNDFVQVLSKILKRHGTSRDKPCLLLVKDKKCLLDLFYKGLLEKVAFIDNICGLSLVYVRTPLGKALRRVRSDELNMEVLLERTYSARISEEHKMLMLLEQSLVSHARALKLGLLLHPCSSDPESLSKIVSEVEAYGCKVALYCNTFFRGENKSS